MTGLRAKQKANRHEIILASAAKLFRDLGYDAVKMETIGQTAEVSIGTIYNYYKNKGDLLVAIVAMEVNDVLAAGEKLIAKPPLSAEKTINALLANYINHSLVYLSKEMWRQAIAISTQQPDSPFGQSYAKLDVALSQQICRLIDKLRDLKMVKSSVDAKAIGELLFNNTNMMFMVFVKSQSMTVIQLRRTIRHQHKQLIEALVADKS